MDFYAHSLNHSGILLDEVYAGVMCDITTDVTMLLCHENVFFSVIHSFRVLYYFVTGKETKQNLNNTKKNKDTELSGCEMGAESDGDKQ